MTKRKGETLDDYLRRLTGKPQDGPMTREEATAILLSVEDRTKYYMTHDRASVDDPSEMEDIRWLKYQAERYKEGQALGLILQSEKDDAWSPRVAFLRLVNIMSWAWEEEDYTTAGRAMIALVELAPNVLNSEDSETEEGES
jgi:hypothetical protein